MSKLDFTAAKIRKTITLVLSIIMLTGTITSFYTSSSSSFINNAQAQSVDNILEDIDCDNINLNGNDIDINTLPQSLGSLGDLIKAEAGDNGISNGEQRAIENFIYKCINNNENESNEQTSTPIPPPPVEGATLSVNKEWFFCNNNDINCIIEPREEGEQLSFEGPNSGNYTECTSDGQCPFANNAKFNITINGNNPIPNTIPAQVNTTQKVKIGAGSFSVTEELFSNRFVPNANFDVQNVPVEQQNIQFIIFIIAFDQEGQRVFTTNADSNSVSIIDLTNPDPSTAATNIPLGSGGIRPIAIAFDQEGQRVFTANRDSSSVSIIDLTNPDPDTAVTNIPLGPSGGDSPIAIAFDQEGQRVFTANQVSGSVSIIDLTNPDPDTAVTNIPLGSGGILPRVIAFDQEGQRVFTANEGSNSVSIIDLVNSNNVTNVSLGPSGGSGPVGIAFDQEGQRVFTANFASNSVSIVDLTNPDPSTAVTNIPLGSGGIRPIAIAFDQEGQRVFTASINSNSVLIIDLTNPDPSTAVTNIPLGPSGGSGPEAIAFDQEGQRVFTANINSNSVSIIDLTNPDPSTAVTNIPLGIGGIQPIAIAFDQEGQRVFTTNGGSNSVSIINFPTVAKICQDSGFDTGDIRTFVSGQQIFEQISCVNFIGECSGNINDGETKECTVQDYVVSLDEVPTDGESGIVSSMNNSQQQLSTNELSSTDNKIQTSSMPTEPFIYDMPKH